MKTFIVAHAVCFVISCLVTDWELHELMTKCFRDNGTWWVMEGACSCYDAKGGPYRKYKC